MALLGAVEFAWRLGADGARGRAEEAVMLADRLADDELRALALNALGNVEAETDVEAARRAYERAAVAARRAGAARAEAAVLGNQGYLLLAHGEIASAMPVFEETVASAERLGDESLRTVAIYNLAFSALGLHRIEEARPLLAEALSAARRLEVREGIPYGLAGAAVYAAMCDRPRVAARLLGAAARESAELGLELSVFEQGLVRDAQAAIAACVDSEARTQADLAGRAWSTDDAVDEALRVLADR
jgi:tetratricopeptide (TPR) repeat protein